MPILRAFFFFILLTRLLPVAGQTITAGRIKGRVTDDQHQPLPLATTTLRKEGDSSAYKISSCDDAGAFLFLNVDAGEYILSITRVGFETLRQKVAIGQINPSGDVGTLILKKLPAILKDFMVRTGVPPVEHRLDKTIVNIGQNISTESATVLEILRKLPGVRVTSDGQITLNGKPGVNVLIDGKATYLSADDLASLLGGMQASGIQRIELMSNPSAKFDAAGTAGIINIVKKRNNKEGINGNVNASGIQGYYGRYNGGFTVSYKDKLINLFLTNSYIYGKKFSSSGVTSDISGNNNELLTEQVSVNSSANTNRTDRPGAVLDIYLSKRLTLTVSGTAGFGSALTTLASSMEVSDSLRNKVSHIAYSSRLGDHPFNYTAGLQLSQQLDTAGGSIIINADHAEYRNSPLQTNYNTATDPAGNFISETDNFLVQGRRLDIYAAKADYLQSLKNKGSIEGGIKSSYVKTDNDNTVYDLTGGQQLLNLGQSDYSINSENINAAYFNLTKNWSTISAEGGLRAEQTVTKGKELLTGDRVNLNYLQLFPTLFLSDKINTQNSFTMRLGRRTDRPDYHELVPFRRPLTATLFFQGNPTLKPQVSWHGELGWNWLQSFTLTLNYDLYTDYVRTLPFVDTNGTTITRRPINIQKANGWEIDMNYNKKWFSCWSIDVTAAVYRNAFNGEVANYSLDNAGLVSVQLNTNNSFQITPTLSLECDFEYDSKRQFVNATFGAYSVLDLGLKRSLLAGKGSLALNANNILQSEDRNAIDRNAGLYQATNLHFYSRSASLSFTYRFGNSKTAKTKFNSGSLDEQNRAKN